MTKILAERISSAFNGIALVSLHLAEMQETESRSLLMKLTRQLLDRAMR